MNTHLGIKTHKCHYNECNKSFGTSGKLRRHINNFHNKLKPFKCEFNNCSKGFGN